jgi:hypothetical protein
VYTVRAISSRAIENSIEGSTTRQNMNLDDLNKKDSSFLKGCLIGDGWLGSHNKKNVELRIGHSSKQLEWLKWKASHLNRILCKSRPVLGPYEVKDGKRNTHQSYIYSAGDTSLFKPWYDKWYVDKEGSKKRIKTIDDEFLEELDLQALAILWCDDGSMWESDRTRWHTLKTGERKGYPYKEMAGSIATCCFSNKENALLSKWIEKLTGVSPSISRTKQYPLLRFCKSKLIDLIPQIKPFIPECMSYKIDKIKI